MSGGSFDYLCFKLEDDVGYEQLQGLHKMEEYLRGRGKHELADEFLRIILLAESHARRLQVTFQHLSSIVHDVEWWASFDIGEDDLDKAAEKFLSKTPENKTNE